MTWLRLLGDESIGLRGDLDLQNRLWRDAHPDLAQRVSTLIEELTAARIPPDRWPFPPETEAAGPFLLGMSVLKAESGYEAMIRALEKRWAADPHNPALTGRLRSGRYSVTPIVDPHEVLAERQRRIASGEPYGYKALARHFGCAATTIRRALERIPAG